MARALYLQHRREDNVRNNKSWRTAVLDDFAELRKAGLTSPLMSAIEHQFAIEAAE
jgi:hypothetical protein